MDFIRLCFSFSNPDAKLVSRYISASMWFIGSLILIRLELSKQNWDGVIIISTPIVWAIVIAMPVLATYAFRERKYLAATLLAFTSLIGIAYTLQATVSRQAINRENTVKYSVENDESRKRVKGLLDAANAMLQEEYELKKDKCDSNPKYNCNQINKSIEIYEAAVRDRKRELKDLGNPNSPLAGEHLLAEFIIILTGKSEADAQWLSATLILVLFGLLCELIAFSSAIYGFHDLRLIPHIPERINKKVDEIEYLQRQLELADNSLDKRVILSKLDKAKNELASKLDIRRLN